MKPIPENILRCMAPKDRPKGTAGMLATEVIERCQSRLERNHQREFASWLKRNEFEFNWSRTDRRITCRVGMPDFTIFLKNGRTLFIEMKMPGSDLSPEQRDVIERLRCLGHTVHIASQAKEAIELTKLLL